MLQTKAQGYGGAQYGKTRELIRRDIGGSVFVCNPSCSTAKYRKKTESLAMRFHSIPRVSLWNINLINPCHLIKCCNIPRFALHVLAPGRRLPVQARQTLDGLVMKVSPVRLDCFCNPGLAVTPCRDVLAWYLVALHHPVYRSGPRVAENHGPLLCSSHMRRRCLAMDHAARHLPYSRLWTGNGLPVFPTPPTVGAGYQG